MHLPPLLAAVECGDDHTVFDLLDDVPDHELTGDDGVTVLAAAAYAGRHEVVWRLVEDGVDVTHPWAGGVDPVTWAAERGAYWVLQSLLIRSGDPLIADSPHRRALQVAQAAIDSAAVWDPGPPPAHWAIVSHLEATLGVHRSPDELMARALVHAQPDHDDWFESLVQLGGRVRTDQELFSWACAAAGDTSSLDRRRFGLDTLNFLSFGIGPPTDEELAGEDDDGLPFAREAAEFLRPLLDTEEDSHALRTVIAAFSSYCSAEELRAILVHVDHADPDIRRCVTSGLAALVTADQPEVVAAFLRLAEDPVPETRASALYAFTRSPVDSPELRGILAAHLADPHFDARIEAAAGLALRGDERGLPALDEIRRGIKNYRSPGAGRLGDISYLLRVRAAAGDQGRLARPGVGMPDPPAEP